jgi:DNA-3-methyladenine glycosylase II
MHAVLAVPAEPQLQKLHVANVRRAGAIAARAPFDFRHSLTFLRAFSPMHGEQAVAAGALTKAMMVRGRPVLLQVSAEGDGLRYTLSSASLLDAETAREAERRLAFFLGTGDDLAPFYALAAEDPAMAPVVARLHGMHHVKLPSPFEAACWGVLNQRIGMPAARAMKDALVRRAGAAVALKGVSHWAFPEAGQIAAIPEEELASLFGSARKAKAVAAVSRAFAGVDEAFLREAPKDDVKAWLEAIHGVGEWTAAFVLFRGLGRFVSVPRSPKFARAAEAVYGRPLDDAALRALDARYGSFGGYWSLYVWASTF